MGTGGDTEATFLILLVISLICIEQVFSSAISSHQNSSIIQQEIAASTNNELGDYSEILHLLTCPGSGIETDRLHNISEIYFRKYGQYEVFPEEFENNGTVLARFTKRDPDCPEGYLETSVQPLIFNENASLDGHVLYRHGWLLKYYNDLLWESIPPNRYCISDFENEDNFTVKYCRTDCGSQPCISKCCYANEVCDLGITDEGCACVDSGPTRWTSTANKFSKNSSFVHHIFEPCDYEHFTLDQGSKNLNSSYQNEFRIDENGVVHFRRVSNGMWFPLEYGSYCVDGAVMSSSEEGELPPFSGDDNDMVLYICRNDLEPFEKEKHDLILYGILVPFAIIFIVLTIVVYLLTWSEQNVHGYTIFFYLVALFFLYTFIVLSNMPTIAHPVNHPISCGFIAGAIHFSYLSSTCWLTSVSFDVFRTFQKMNGCTARSKGLRRFTLYTLFSIGYPLAQVTVCAVLDALYRDTPHDQVTFSLPDYGYGGLGCNMSNDGITYYLYIPITLLLICNIGFFVATIVIMKLYKRSIREAFSGIDSSASTKVNQSFGIYARLFIIMGIFWVTQIISWFVLVQFKDSPEPYGLQTIFAITDALTVLQSVVIFYIFVCKRNVFTNLWTLQPWLRPFLSLWVAGGCCVAPPNDSRKVPSRPNSGNTLVSSLTTKDSLVSGKGPGENHRVSKDSTESVELNMTNAFSSSSVVQEGSRKISGESSHIVKTDSDMNNTNMVSPRSSVRFSDENIITEAGENTAETMI